MSGAGDVNGDGLDDLIVGALGADPNGEDSGQSYVVFGKADAAAVELADVAAGRGGGFALNGAAAYDSSGFSVSGAGDVNGDGLDDLIVGAPSPTRTATTPARATWCSARRTRPRSSWPTSPPAKAAASPSTASPRATTPASR